MAVQTIVERDQLLDKVKQDGAYLMDLLRQTLGNRPYVGDIRGRGFFIGIELVADRPAKEPFDPALQLFSKIRDRTFANGLICYPTGGNVDGVKGDQVILAPPYNASRAELDEIVDKLADEPDRGDRGSAEAALDRYSLPPSTTWRRLRQRSMPPGRLAMSVEARLLQDRAVACAERPPARHTVTIGLSLGKLGGPLRRSSPSGISVGAADMAQRAGEFVGLAHVDHLHLAQMFLQPMRLDLPDAGEGEASAAPMPGSSGGAAPSSPGWPQRRLAGTAIIHLLRMRQVRDCFM